MQRTIENSGVYILEIYARRRFSLNLKKYSGKLFSKGYYYYTGSAQKNLRQRLNRHLLKSKKIYWHIDYITVHEETRIVRIYKYPECSKSLECFLSREISFLKEIEIAANGFGNSDCNKCRTHLYFSRKRIDQSHLISLYQSAVCLMPSSKEIF